MYESGYYSSIGEFNRWWILFYFYFYGHVKLLIECPNLAHGGAVYNYPYQSGKASLAKSFQSRQRPLAIVI